MFKRLIALVPIAVVAAFLSPAGAPNSSNDRCRRPHLPDGALNRTDLWISTKNGVPLRTL
jgi:hypothetical protein